MPTLYSWAYGEEFWYLHQIFRAIAKDLPRFSRYSIRFIQTEVPVGKQSTRLVSGLLLLLVMPFSACAQRAVQTQYVPAPQAGAPAARASGETATASSQSTSTDARQTRPVASHDSTRAQATTSETSTSTSNDLGDDSVYVIPPEVISGSYLTCTSLDRDTHKAPEGYGYTSCEYYDREGNPVATANAAVDFHLHDVGGKVVEAEEVAIPNVNAAVVWRVPLATLAQGVKGSLTVYDKSGGTVAVELASDVVIEHLDPEDEATSTQSQD